MIFFLLLHECVVLAVFWVTFQAKKDLMQAKRQNQRDKKTIAELEDEIEAIKWGNGQSLSTYLVISLLSVMV